MHRESAPSVTGRFAFACGTMRPQIHLESGARMPVYKLVLYPADTGELPSIDDLLTLLHERGLSGPPLPCDGIHRFATGDHFLEDIVFLGCAPRVELDPPRQEVCAAAQAGTFSQVGISQFREPRLRVDPNAAARCPSCRKSLPRATPPPAAADLIICPHCDISVQAGALQWRQSGACARLFVDIIGIGPGEAVPADGLLSALGRLRPVSKWRFAYIAD